MSQTPASSHEGNPVEGQNIWSLLFPGEFQQGEPCSMALITAIKKGLPGAAIGEIARIFDLNKNQIYSLLHLKPKTAQRAGARSSLSLDTSDHIVQLVKLFIRCTELFGSRTKASLWLTTPNHTLGGELPLQFMDTLEGISLVHDTVTRVEYGVFS